MALSPNKEKIVNEMLVQIEAGKLYNEVLKLNATKWCLSVRTFARYWKAAQQQYADRLAAIKKEQAIQSTQAALNRNSEAIASKQERMEAVTRVLRGQSRIAGKRTIYPTEDQIIKAAEYLSKIEGDYAPEKREVTEKSTPIFSFSEVIDVKALSTETIKDVLAHRKPRPEIKEA